MKHKTVCSLALAVVLTGSTIGFARQKVSVEASSEAAEGMDLRAVAELFKDAQNLEEFEKALNDPDTGVNNLDLDDNGEVDFIRVVEEVGGDSHLIVLQVPLGKDEFQDVATIEIERTGNDRYNMQITGNGVIYGPDYYVAPAYVGIHTWSVVRLIYGPAYRPYRSAYYFGVYPRWWKPYRPVTVGLYRARTVWYTSRATFRVTRTRTVRTTRVAYTPRSSTLVRKRTTVTRTKGRTTVTRTKTTRKKRP